MRQFLSVLFILVALPAEADDWLVLKGEEIPDTLSDRIVDYDAAWQDFRASGQTLYNAGADSWGAWDIRNNQYCSQWPPNSSWTCYDVDLNADGTAVRFRGTGEDVTVGTLRGSN